MTLASDTHNSATRFLKRATNRIRSDLDWSLRRLTARQRALPDFLIIGAQKAGTSSLFSYLAQHPKIMPSSKKEVHYFDGGLQEAVDTYALGENWYRSHFPYRTRLAQEEALTFEASPQYLYSPLVPQRIASRLPDAKLLAVLRNPVERAISHYYHEVRMGRENRPIEMALDVTDAIASPDLSAFKYKDPTQINKSYITRGLYADQIKRYWQHFDPAQIHIVDSAQMKKDATFMEDVFTFLGITEQGPRIDLSWQNVNTTKRGAVETISKQLSHLYHDPNEELFEILDVDFGWNKKAD